MGDNEQLTHAQTPTLTDYVAGAMLANGFVWIWIQLLGNLRNFFSNFSQILLADITYIIYLAGSILASYLICKRASTGHLIVGIKFAGSAWVLSLFFMLSMIEQPTLGLAITFLLCFLSGGIAGAYLFRRSMLKKIGASQVPRQE